MIQRFLAVAFILSLLLTVQSQAAPATTPADAITTDDPTQAITELRQDLIDSFNKADLDRLLSHLDPDVLVTWQNGEVCHGPDAVRAYYNKMMSGPDRRVEKVAADPKVDGRHVHGDWAVSWGHMNDHFTLTDGSNLDMNSQFTATIAKRGNAWKVTSFHVSVNAFDNPILKLAARKTGGWAGVIGVVVGTLIGLIIGRRTRKTAPGDVAPAAGDI
jgi:uncharacterized protein (TIGR02246 family)